MEAKTVKIIRTGIIRRFDDLGRIVIPKEIRRKIGAEGGSPFEISLQGNSVILTKYPPEEDE